MKSCIDSVPVPLRTDVLLGEPALHRAVIVRDEYAAVIGMAVGMGKEGDKSALFPVVSHKTVEVDIEHRICIEQEKVLRELAAELQQRTCIAKGLLLDIIAYIHAEAASVTEVVHDVLGKM